MPSTTMKRLFMGFLHIGAAASASKPPQLTKTSLPVSTIHANKAQCVHTVTWVLELWPTSLRIQQPCEVAAQGPSTRGVSSALEAPMLGINALQTALQVCHVVVPEALDGRPR